MVNGIFVDAFCDFLEDYNELVYLVQDVFQATYESLILTRENRLKSVATALNISESNCEQLATRYFNSLFQEYSLNVFAFTEEYYHNLIAKIKAFREKRIDSSLDLSNWMESSDLKKFLEALHKLYLHMVLNDPQIELKMQNSLIYKEFIRSSYTCLDGFPKDGAACVIVIPAPMRQGHIYQGIKGSVVIIKNPSKEILEIIEKEKAEKQKQKCENADKKAENQICENPKPEIAKNTENIVEKSIKPDVEIKKSEPENKNIDKKPEEPIQKEKIEIIPISKENIQKTEKIAEPEVIIQENIKPKTTKPISIKYEVSQKSWHGRGKPNSNKRNHSLQIDEPSNNIQNQGNTVDLVKNTQETIVVDQAITATIKPAICEDNYGFEPVQPIIQPEIKKTLNSSQEEDDEIKININSKDCTIEQSKITKCAVSHRQPSPMQNSARRLNIPMNRASTARGVHILPQTQIPITAVTPTPAEFDAIQIMPEQLYTREDLNTKTEENEGNEFTKNSNSKSVNKTFQMEAWGCVRPTKANNRTPAKICDESYDTKAKEWRKKIIQMGKQSRLQRSGRGEEQNSKLKEIDQSTPDLGRSYKSANRPIEDELKKSISKLRPVKKIIETEKNNNMPLQPSKIMTQQEKLQAYQRVLKAKMSSIKNSGTNECEITKPKKGATICETKKTAMLTTQDTEPLSSNYDSIKTSFHSRIQELNAKLFKYKKSIKGNEEHDFQFEPEKKSSKSKGNNETMYKKLPPHKENGLNGSLINSCHSPGGPLNSGKKSDEHRSTRQIIEKIAAKAEALRNKENNENKKEKLIAGIRMFSHKR